MTALATEAVWLNVAVNVPLQALAPDMIWSDGVDYVWHGIAPSQSTTQSTSTLASTLISTEPAPQRGSIVIIRWAGRQCLGVVLSILKAPRYDPEKILPATLLPQLIHYPVPDGVLRLAQFASQYYHRPIGEILLPTISAARSAALPALKSPAQLPSTPLKLGATLTTLNIPPLNSEQTQALLGLTGTIPTQFAVHLLYGITGSGKTEVYLARAAQTLATGQQVLLLVPEIVLVPAMMARVKRALPHASIAALHSEVSLAQRRKTWQACLQGEINILIGTRLAVFAPLPAIGLIVVDEEHDPSYKQQEGVRYCARNLAIMRGQLTACPVILGSATPSLETWLKAQEGKYQFHRLLHRAKASALPDWGLVNLLHHPTKTGLSAPILTILERSLAKGEQSLVFLNRRGYAPTLTCTGCGWASDCANCSSHLALHRLRGVWKLICHHCSVHSLPPKDCPKCGSLQLEPEGQGTQAIEQTLREHLPNARLARLDSDVTRQKGQGKEIAAMMAAGELDILVGTQMTAKGHDFPALSTVVVVGCDGALLSPDYRGVERLFALLTQVSGRAGRADVAGTVWLQTRQPDHPLFAALRLPTVDIFYEALLAERAEAGLPPYTYQAVLRASHPKLEEAIAWLTTAKQMIDPSDCATVRVFSPIPLLMPKIATQFRAQILLESGSRAALHQLLSHAVPKWVAYGKGLRCSDSSYGIQWHLELDPSDV